MLSFTYSLTPSIDDSYSYVYYLANNKNCLQFLTIVSLLGLTREYVHVMFTFASFFNFLGPLLLGIVLDLYGPRICSIVSISLIAIGCILFGYSDIESNPMFIPAMCLIAFGGPGAQNAIIHLSNLFPTWKATATAFITGSFQISFFVFVAFEYLWMKSKIDYCRLFIGYSVICAVNIVISVIFWPDKPYLFNEELAYIVSHPDDFGPGCTTIQDPIDLNMKPTNGRYTTVINSSYPSFYYRTKVQSDYHLE